MSASERSSRSDEAKYDEKQVEIQTKSADRYGQQDVVPAALAMTIARELTLALQGKHPAQRRLTPLSEQQPIEIGLDDVLQWADGVRAAQGTELANRITPEEERIAWAIAHAPR